MARVEARRYAPHLMVLAAVLVTYGILAQPRTMRGNPEGPIPLTMPDRLGPYSGEELFFCQNDQCARSFRASQLAESGMPPGTCTTCTNRLDTVSIGERRVLPPGTPIFRKVYATRDSPDIQLTLVFSGAERMSIHRPQVCLVAQGHQIINEFDYDVPSGDGRRMPVRIIEAMYEQSNEQGCKTVDRSIYAYWFFSPERHTAGHFRRMFWLAYDNALRNYRPRWAYVSLAMQIDPHQPDAWRALFDDFVPRFYPLIEELQAGLRRQDGIEASESPEPAAAAANVP